MALSTPEVSFKAWDPKKKCTKPSTRTYRLSLRRRWKVRRGARDGTAGDGWSDANRDRCKSLYRSRFVPNRLTEDGLTDFRHGSEAGLDVGHQHVCFSPDSVAKLFLDHRR